jgi:hypothetical protein
VFLSLDQAAKRRVSPFDSLKLLDELLDERIGYASNGE